MALPESYLVATKKVDVFFNTILNAQAPQKFTTRFLLQLEFKTTNDRLFIGVLKSLKFIDQSGVPQERYFKFLDQTQSKSVLADAIRDTYADLFSVNVRANEMNAIDVKNKFKTLTQGTKSDAVLTWMANTFYELCKYADFSKESPKEVTTVKGNTQILEDIGQQKETQKMTHELVNKNITTEMHYNIQIHLPETRDITVYDAIFKSLKEHLL